MKKILKRLGEILIEGGIVSQKQLNNALMVQHKERKLLGEILVRLNYITKEKLDLALARQFGSKLGEILIKDKLINFKQLHRALEKQAQVNRSLGEVLTDLGYVSEQNLLKALSLRYNISFVDLKKYKINIEALNKVPVELCREHNVLPVDIKDGYLVIATATPEDVITEENIEVITGMKVRIIIASAGEIKKRVSP
ncbi:MAG: hypothetical protein U9Q08_01655 [Candidatus Omnitrophota bacterium]|nr:hypothetical protein [Candidatus Omnitrophota bacterium]